MHEIRAPSVEKMLALLRNEKIEIKPVEKIWSIEVQFCKKEGQKTKPCILHHDMTFARVEMHRWKFNLHLSKIHLH